MKFVSVTKGRATCAHIAHIAHTHTHYSSYSISSRTSGNNLVGTCTRTHSILTGLFVSIACTMRQLRRTLLLLLVRNQQQRAPCIFKERKKQKMERRERLKYTSGTNQHSYLKVETDSICGYCSRCCRHTSLFILFEQRTLILFEDINFQLK